MSKRKLRALISIDNHFVQLPNGDIKCENIVNQSFWDRYLEVFDTIDVFVRTENVSDEITYDTYNDVSHSNVNIIPIPMFRSIKELISNYKEIRKIIKEVSSKNTFSAVVIRLPSLLGYMVSNIMLKNNYPLGVEVVADMSVAPAESGLGGKIKYKIFHKLLKYYVAKADGVAYVTKFALQRNYPAHAGAVQGNYSSIDLRQSYFYEKQAFEDDTNPFRLVHVSTLNSNAKGHKIFIDTINKLLKAGYLVEGTIVGGGVYKDHYESYCKELKIKDYIKFTGAISDPMQLRELYISSSALLFPSEFEGLPRTVIEAMACSLAVVASNVGGIPELLEDKWMSTASDSSFYYDAVQSLIENPSELEKTSKRNYIKALEYESSKIQNQRNSFFKALLEAK